MTSAGPRQPGTIITFYSYKGGTGRSMALANVAWILASNGHRVLVVDWDLEAPGLHRYFAPFMLDPDLTESEGVIDIVNDYVAAALTKADDGEGQGLEAAPPPEEWSEPYANVLRYAASLEHAFAERDGRKGWIDFIPAGRQGPAYATRMNAFSWQNFYDRFGGGGFIERIKQRMKAEYDYVLIDSRTGVSDTSGICTVQLPDVLAVCFTLNRQSIEGASAVAASVEAQRRNGDGRALRIFPIPTRVEKAEKEKLDVAREVAKEAFAPLMTVSGSSEVDHYWGQVEVFYEPFYAYEEVLAVFGDKPLQTSSLLASMERITSWLTDWKVTQLAPIEESARQTILAKYARQSRKAVGKATQPAAARSICSTSATRGRTWTSTSSASSTISAPASAPSRVCRRQPASGSWITSPSTRRSRWL